MGPDVEDYTPASPILVPTIGSIKEGTLIFQDHRSCRWPVCCPPNAEYEGEPYQHKAKNPDMRFTMTWDTTGKHWDCVAPGYGQIGNYGNGSIFVSDPDGIVIHTSNEGEQHG